MCPLWPLHLLVMYALILCPLLFVSCGVAAQVADRFASRDATSEALAQRLEVQYAHAVNSTAVDPNAGVSIHMDEKHLLQFDAKGLQDEDWRFGELYTESDDPGLVDTEPKKFVLSTSNVTGSSWRGFFNVSGEFLGQAEVRVCLRRAEPATEPVKRCGDPVRVKVTRRKRVIDSVFTGSVATLVAVIFVNFGCTLDWDVVKGTIKRPVGPIIGFTSQYVVMPVISFGLAKLLFPDNAAMQLGLFFTGVSPGGGASNIWTYLLGGNLNLSITMTTLSTILAFGMMPLWIFTLGRQIFDSNKLTVPYWRVMEIAVALVIPVFIGWLIQRFLPRVSKFMVRILKPFSALLIAFIVIFATITNFYIFKLFTWRIFVAGLGLPWLGYLCGLSMALLFRQKWEDVLAISVETGVHNTGIAIFMLGRTLDQPEADLTTVAPVAVAIMTPIPLTIAYIVKRCRARWTLKKKDYNFSDEERAPTAPLASSTEPFTIIAANGSANNNRDKY